MKWNVLGALMVSMAMASPSFGFGLLDRMLGSGCGCAVAPSYACCEKPICCEPACHAPVGHGAHCCDPCAACCGHGGCGLLDGLFGAFRGGFACGHACCEPACCVEPACCAPAAHCCAPRRGLLNGLFGGLRGCGCGHGGHFGHGCCQPTCCVEPTCCAPAHCEPACCAPAHCCPPRLGLLDRLCGMFRGCGCHAHCGPSCCVEPACGCPSYGPNGFYKNGNGPIPAEADQGENSALMPIPPMPMADPNVRVAPTREVVRTSFLR